MTVTSSRRQVGGASSQGISFTQISFDRIIAGTLPSLKSLDAVWRLMLLDRRRSKCLIYYQHWLVVVVTIALPGAELPPAAGIVKYPSHPHRSESANNVHCLLRGECDRCIQLPWNYLGTITDVLPEQ